MRRRAVVLLTAVLSVGALALGTSVATAGASVPAQKKAAPCAGKTKKKAQKQITTAWDYFLNGPKGYTNDQKVAFIQGMDDAELRETFERLSGVNADQATTTSFKINTITCDGKKSATVEYDLVINGAVTPGIAAPGDAVIDDGTWKVSQQTYCDLSSLGDPTLLESGPCAL
jgi:hypothetical protein